MKIAYTINGLVGGFSGRNSNSTATKDDHILILKYLSNIFKNNIADHNDVDVFIFSWHTDLEEEFNKYYAPKRMKLKPQIDFSIPAHLASGNVPRVIAHKSRWYGFKEVMNLVWEYEIDNKFKYDMVVSARFDICWNKPYKFDKLDRSKFHIPWHPNWADYGWPQNGEEILDHVFAARSIWMQHYSSLFDLIDEYTLPGQCPQWNTISNHFLMVWHLRQLGILDETTVLKSFSTPKDKTSWYNNQIESDYDIFRYRELSPNDVIKSMK